MTKQETYIQFIIDELQKGNVLHKDVLAQFGIKWHNSERTFNRYWTIANERYLEAQKLINQQKTKEYTSSQIEQKKADILTREKVVEMTSNVVKLAYNNVVSTKGDEKTIYAYTSAVEKLNKLEGYDKPSKIDSTINGVDEIIIKRKVDN